MNKSSNILFSSLYQIYINIISNNINYEENSTNIIDLLIKSPFGKQYGRDQSIIKDAINAMLFAKRELLINLLSNIFDEDQNEIIKLLRSIPVEIVNYAKDLNLPKYATLDSACLDLISAEEEAAIQPQERKLIGTGIKIALPIGSVGYIFARSGLAVNHGIILANSIGIIDPDYRGEIKVALTNISKKEYAVRRGDRIAQFMVMAYSQIIFDQCNDINKFATARNQGGFGSTGKA